MYLIKQLNYSVKTYVYFLIGLLLILNFACNTTSDELTISDDEFYKILSEGSIQESMAKVDSILLVHNNKHPKLGILYYKKGVNLSKLQKDQLAVENLQKALLTFKEKEKNKYIGETFWLLGSSNTFLSNISLANEQLLTALAHSKTHNNEQLEAKVYGSIAHIHFIYSDYIKAVNYTQKAIDIHIKRKDTVGLSATYNNMAVIYKNTNEYFLALDYNFKSLDLNILKKDKSAIAKSYNNLGLVSSLMQQKTNALDFYTKAIAINKEIESSNISAYLNLGELYLNDNEFYMAKNMYLSLLESKNQSNKLSTQKIIYNQLLELSIKQKEYKNSLIFRAKKDSLDRLQIVSDNKEKLNFIENQYKAVVRENKLQQENDINDKNRVIFVILIGVLVLLLVFVFQRNKNAKLVLVQEKLELEQSVLRSQMNPHFIFNALSAIQNSLLDNKPIQSASYISRFAKLIRQNFDFINEKSILLTDEIDVLRNYMDTQKMRYQDKFDYEINVFADVDMDTNEIPPLLLQPFVENAIEHGFKNIERKGKITINISKEKDSILYEIKDNGRGFSDIKSDHKLHATDIFKKRLKLLNNKDEESFNISSSEKGTTVKFCIKQ